MSKISAWSDREIRRVRYPRHKRGAGGIDGDGSGQIDITSRDIGCIVERSASGIPSSGKCMAVVVRSGPLKRVRLSPQRSCSCAAYYICTIKSVDSQSVDFKSIPDSYLVDIIRS